MNKNREKQSDLVSEFLSKKGGDSAWQGTLQDFTFLFSQRQKKG